MPRPQRCRRIGCFPDRWRFGPLDEAPGEAVTLTLDELVDQMVMGRNVFFNKLKSLTGLSPVEFIREMRIKRAAQLLEEHKYNITEVTYMVGMNDSRYFAKCFKNTYGVTPTEYRRASMEGGQK